MSDNSHHSSEGEAGVLSPTRATAVVRFRIAGPVAMLSHAETARVWQRACARAGLPVRYSAGFNPHPRLSLPLPRPVGVEAADELLVVRLSEDPAAGADGRRPEYETALRRALAEQMPAGMDVLSVTLAAANASFVPWSAEYVLPLRIEVNPGLAGRLESEIAGVMGSEHCMVERTAGEKKPSRCVDVRPFLLSVRLEGGRLIVQHRTGEAGSIRVDEILRLFSLRTEDLAGPVRRVNVVWETTKQHKTIQPPRSRSGAEDSEDVTRDVD